MELTAFSDRGIGTRDRLEDYAADRIITTPGGLQLQIAIVCDGAGGGEAGELAARLTSRTIFEYLEITPEQSVPKLLIKAVEQANKAVYSELRGTGTSTVALAAVHLNDPSAPYGRLYIANVGNSRIYLMRAGHLVRLNIDHTLQNEYVFAGQMSFEEAKQLEDPEYVTRAIGIGAQVSVDIGFYVEKGKSFVNSRRAFRIGQKGMLLQEGDTVFAASDGLFPFLKDEELLTHALDDNVERATRTLLKYAADRGPEDNIALSMLFVPSSSRKMVQTGPRLSRRQRAGISVFLLAIILLVGFLGVQAVNGEQQRVAFVATQTEVQKIILKASFTATPTPTATPTQAPQVGQVGNRYTVTQSYPVFAGRFLEGLDEVNYVSLNQEITFPANLYLQPNSSIQLKQVKDRHIDMVLGHSGDLFVNLGDYQQGGISIALEDNPDITIESQSECLSVKLIPADQNKPLDNTNTDKVALACYGNNAGNCSYHLPGVQDAVSVAVGQQAFVDIINLKPLPQSPISPDDVVTYATIISQLKNTPDQLRCISSIVDSDQDGVINSLDQCPDVQGLPDLNGCPPEGLEGTPFVLTQAAEAQRATSTPVPTSTFTPTPTYTATPTYTPTPSPIVLPDNYSTGQDTSLTRDAALGVLANDQLYGDSLVTYSQHTTAKGGTVTLHADGSFVYKPPTGFTGTDTFTYSLTTSGASATVTIEVIEPTPEPVVASFTVSPSSGASPLLVSVNDISTGPVSDWDWDFGDGSPHSFSSNPGAHTYVNNSASALSFTITLTVTGLGGDTDSASQKVTVEVPPPVACFTTSSSPVSNGTGVNFQNCSTGTITTYDWDFGDGSPHSSAANPGSHTYLNSSTNTLTFTVTLRVTGPGGSDQIASTVTVPPPAPIACFSPADNTTITASNTPITFDASCTGNKAGATFSWVFSDGNNPPNGQTATHVYNAASPPGGFKITLTVTSPGGTSTLTHTMFVNAAPLPPTGCTIAPATSATLAVNFSVNCTSGGLPITAYSWNFGDTANNTSTLANPLHTFTKVGKFHITVFVTGTGGAQATVEEDITIGNLPASNADTYNTTMNTALNVAAPGVLANDNPPIPAGTTITDHTDPTNGVLNTFSTNGSFKYTPKVGFAGKDTFTYTLTNATGSAPPQTVTICVNPKANNDTYAMTTNTTLTIASPGVLANDVIPTTGTIITFSATSANGGTITSTPTGGFSYSNPGFTGTDTFTYTVSIAGCPVVPATGTGTVTLNVRAADQAPVALADNYTTAFNKTLNVNAAQGVLNNAAGKDTDADGDPLIALLIGSTTNGTLSLQTDGSFTYTPNPGYSGPDTFTYQASDGGLNSATVTVTITITANNPPNAVADSYNTGTNQTLTVAAPGVLTNDSDADGNPLTVDLATVSALTPASGTLTMNANGDGGFTYVPPNGFNGTVTFTYNAFDGAADSPTAATVTIVVGGANNPPVANPDGYSTGFNASLVVNAAQGVLNNDTDPDGDTLGAVLVSSTTNGGSLAFLPNGSFTYTPPFGYTGTDTFRYQANDGNGGTSNIATVTITIVAPPTANTDIYNIPINGTINTPITAPGILGNDNPTTGLTAIKIFPGPGTSFFGGALTLTAGGDITYTAPGGFIGQDFFYYEATDAFGQFSNIAVVIINIGFGNGAPTAGDDTYGVVAGNNLVVPGPGNLPTLLSNDTDPDGNSLQVVPTGAITTAQNGTVTMAATGSFTYTPPSPTFVGPDSFTYQATDGQDVSNVATVTINVTSNAGNTAPVAGNDAYPLALSKTVTSLNVLPAAGVLKNDFDADGDAMTAVLVGTTTTTQGGTVALNPDGSFTYTPPAPNFKGTDTFSYQARDVNAALSNIATVTISVGVARRPVAIEVPAPPPATACTDTNFENPGMIRSHFTVDADRADLYCRLIAADGNYMYWFGSPITNAGNVGAQNVLDLGLVAAVDVFSMRDVSGFIGDVDICLKGTGYMIYMNVLGQPRVPQLWSAWTTDAFPGYTCTTLYAPGTVILVANKPK